MSKSKDKLLEVLEDYRVYVLENFPENSKNPVTEQNINEFGKQLYYALLTFKQSIEDLS